MPKLLKTVVRPGTYRVFDPDGPIVGEDGKRYRNETITPERIAHWAKTHNDMKQTGLRIPSPWRHDPNAEPIRLKADLQDVDSFNNAGFWESLWQDPNDHSLKGIIDVPDTEAAKKLGNEVKDTSILAKGVFVDGDGITWKDAITHIALVTHPIEKNQETFQLVPEEVAASLYMSHLMMCGEEDDQINSTKPDIKTALKVLRKIGLRLPDDTTEKDLLRNIIIAGTALTDDGEDDNEDSKADKQKPSPVVMGVDFMTIPKFDPFTGKPLTPEQVAEHIAKAKIEKGEVQLQMSSEDKAAVNFAQNAARQTYVSRIESLVKKNAITKKYADEELLPLTKDLQMSFNEDGTPKPNVLDTILKPLEKLPSIDLTKQRVVRMSAEEETIEPSGEMDDNAIEDVIKTLAQSSGRQDLVAK